MVHDGQKRLLNDAQKNSLTITLRLLEERILELKRLKREQQLIGLLFHFENDIPSEKLDQLDQRFDRILQLIEQAKAKFNLPEKTTTLSSYLNAFTSYFWSLLMDERSEKLTRYGEVQPGLQPELDPLIEQLVDELQAIDRSQR